MSTVPTVSPEWLVLLVNNFAPQPRAAAGESDTDLPDLNNADAPAIAAGVADSARAKIAGQLWPVFAGQQVADQVDALTPLLHRAELDPAIDADGQVRWTTRHTDPAAQLLAGCATTLAHAAQAHGWKRLGLCEGSDCADVYLDQHGRSRRRYCSTTCLNRARIRAYRARQRVLMGEAGPL